MKTFAALLSALAIASALDFDWNRVRPRHVDPSIPGLFPSQHITGGEEAVPNSFPYQVGLFLTRDGGGAFCGGTLINPRWVLTTARCVDDVSEVTVVLGAHNIRDSSEPGRVEIVAQKANIIMHEQYVPFVFRNDIALIKIPAVELTDTIQTINLPGISEFTNNFEGRDSVASGWGKASDAQSGISDRLHYMNVKVMNLTICKLVMLFLPSNQNICTDGTNGRSICNVDFGGPLTVLENASSRMLIGLTSFSMPFGCQRGPPVVFTRITSYMAWITKKSGIVPRP